jgi:hypothetical protein
MGWRGPAVWETGRTVQRNMSIKESDDCGPSRL